MSQLNSKFRPEYLDTYFAADLASKELPTRLGVITAYNPNGRLAAKAANVKADSRLKQHLETSKLPHFRVTGRSRDGSHQEPGFGVVVDDPKEIETLAQLFQQEAFFWIQEGEVYCVKVGDSTMHRVGPWTERQISSPRERAFG
ncbi:MAG: DUF3293 domain-containing protein [Gammaproteobacteria bacterium]